jgi:CHAT domain-containing protein
VAARPDDGAAVARAWDALIRSRTLVLDEMAARRVVAGSGDPTVRKLQNRAHHAGLRLTTLVHRGPGTDAAMIEAAQRELDASQAQLGLASAPLQAAYERDHAGLREVQAALPEASALVAFARYDPARLAGTTQGARSELTAGGYLAFVLARPGAATKSVALGDTARLDRLLSFWQACLSDVRAAMSLRYRSESDCRDVGLAVTRALWDPLAPHLRRAKRVFIVPDGPLHALNLAALPVQAGGYLVESGPTLHYLTSERDLLPRATPQARHTDLIAFGAPAFDATPQRVADAPLPAPWSQEPARMADARPVDAARPVFRGSPPACASDVPRDWPTLPGTRAEVEDLLQIWSRQPGAGQSWLLEREGAGETALKLLASRARILHLATHGFAQNDACATRAAVRSRDNPLLRSGVVLAGANHRDQALPGQDDGVLTAEEAASLDLEGTEWVVLSGCHTGRGALHHSDGVLGLRRAFAIAGARTVIMSLWSVDDASARAWMNQLYRARLEQGLATADAVWQASRAVLARRRAAGQDLAPRHWAGFIATGDWR